MKDFLGNVLLLLGSGILLMFVWLSYVLAHHRGRVRDKSLHAYYEWYGEIGFLTTVIGYPIWLLGYFLWDGDNLPDKNPPPEPTPPVPAFDIEGTIAKLGFELSREYGRSDLLGELMVAAQKSLAMDYLAPKETSPEWLDKLRRANGDDALGNLKRFCRHLLNAVPSPPKGSHSHLTSPFVEIVPADVISEAFSQLGANRLFPETYGEFCRAAGIANFFTSTQSKKLDPTHKPYEEDGAEWKRTALRSFPDLANVPVEVHIPTHLRFEGTWVLAPQGRGKTTLLSVMIADDLDKVARGEASVVAMGSKGDIIEHLAKHQRFAPGGDLAGKLTLIEPEPELSINPLDLGATTGHTIDLLEELFVGLMGAETTPKQLLFLRKIVLFAKAVPNANLLTLRQMLLPKKGWEKYAEHLPKTDDLTREYFENGYFDDSGTAVTKEALFNKIEGLITRVDLLKEMFKATETKVRMAELMDAGRVIVIDNSEKKLSESGAEFFGRFFIANILAAAQQRAGRDDTQKKPCFVYIDEADVVIRNDNSVPKIIQRCRSQKIAMTFAHQNIGQIKSEAVQGALFDCTVKFANPSKDANALADSFRTEDTKLRGLDKGQFALMIEGVTKTALILDVENNPAVGWPQMTPSQLETIRMDMAESYHYELPAAQPADEPDPDSTAPAKWGQ